MGAFTCEPALVQYAAQEMGGEDSEEPPTLSYTGYHGNGDDSDSEEAEAAVGMEGGWESVEALPPDEPPIEAEVYQERMKHLDYNSTYLDYLSLGTSGQSRPSPASAEGSVSAESTGGLLDTISSLWSSTFSRTT